jgi:hypothetical protein
MCHLPLRSLSAVLTVVHVSCGDAASEGGSYSRSEVTYHLVDFFRDTGFVPRPGDQAGRDSKKPQCTDGSSQH